MNRLKNLLNTASNKNLTTLVVGSAIAQVLSLIAYPIITRIYQPEQFGIFSLITTSIGIISLLASGRFEVAIVLPTNKTESRKLLQLALKTLTIFSISVTTILGIVYSWNYFFYQKIEIDISFLILGFGIFILGFLQALGYWFNKSASYKILSNARIINSASTTFFTIFFGLIFKNSWGLLLGYFTGNILQLLFYFNRDKLIIKVFQKSFRKDLSILLIAKRYINFPLVNLPQAFLNAIQFNILIYLIDFCFSKNDVGNVSLALRIMLLPVNLIGASLAQLIYKEAVDSYNNGLPLYQLTNSYIKKSFLIYLPVFICFLLSPFLFQIIFGSKWESAGNYTVLLAVWFFADFIKAPIAQLVLIMNKQKEWLYASIAGITLIITTFFISNFIAHKIEIVLLCTSVCACFVNVFWILYIKNIINK